MIRTRVGYAGGLKQNPTYVAIGDHTETVQIDYDPQRITYEDLLAIFWDLHDPTDFTISRQYLNAIFYSDENQRDRALASRTAREKHGGRQIRTDVLPLHTFTPAEDYHQKYLLKRQTALTRELSRIYPEPDDFVNSPTVSRINGYVGGYGSRAQLQREIGMLGLSPEGRKKLERLVGNRSE